MSDYYTEQLVAAVRDWGRELAEALHEIRTQQMRTADALEGISQSLATIASQGEARSG